MSYNCIYLDQMSRNPLSDQGLNAILRNMQLSITGPVTILVNFIWSSTHEKGLFAMCEQRRPWSACESMQINACCSVWRRTRNVYIRLHGFVRLSWPVCMWHKGLFPMLRIKFIIDEFIKQTGLNVFMVLSNFNDSNIFGAMIICPRHG